MHSAAIPRILLEPDSSMFAANVLATQNVIEAAISLEAVWAALIDQSRPLASA